MSKYSITAGDRIVITNISEDHHYRDLYFNKSGEPVGVVDNRWNENPDTVRFYTGYVPFKKRGAAMETFSPAGCGYSCRKADLRFIGAKPADFWQFKGDVVRAHNGETYTEVVDWYEVEFSKVYG